MKKLLTLTAVGAILATPATAVQRCINFTNNHDAPFELEIMYNGVDFDVFLDSGLHIDGVGFMSSTTGSTNDKRDWIQADTGDNCWCRMVRPALSRWVFIGTQADIASLTETNTCAEFCALELSYDSSPYRAIIGSIYE